MTADLLARAQAGDGDAFGQLVDPYRRELQVYCYRFLGSVADAEDVWLTMPPLPLEYLGRELAARFLTATAFRPGWTARLIPARATGQPASWETQVSLVSGRLSAKLGAPSWRWFPCRACAISCGDDGRARGDRAGSAAAAADRDRLRPVFTGCWRLDVGRLAGQPATGPR